MVTASERAARSLTCSVSRRRAEGLTAWPAPRHSGLANLCTRRMGEHAQSDRPYVLNALQEQSLWAAILQLPVAPGSPVEGPRHQVASLAMDAHGLLCAYAPRLLNQNARGADGTGMPRPSANGSRFSTKRAGRAT